jgi:hypothetical protein
MLSWIKAWLLEQGKLTCLIVRQQEPEWSLIFDKAIEYGQRGRIGQLQSPRPGTAQIDQRAAVKIE